MGYFLFAVIATVVVYFMLVKKKSNKSPDGTCADIQKLSEIALPTISLDTNGLAPKDKQGSQPTVVKPKESAGSISSVKGQIEYLNAQWMTAKKERDSGAASTFPGWFFEPATPRQLARLKKDGTNVSGGSLTKGAASDLIGLREPLEVDDAKVLKFFKIALKDMSQTLGRYEVKRLLSNPENEKAWKARPAEPMQNEYLTFFGIEMPKGLTAVGASQLIEVHRKDKNAQDEKKISEWQSFTSILDELEDRETLEEYEIKKPSLKAVKVAMSALRAEGEDAGDLQLVVDKLIEMKPELARGV